MSRVARMLERATINFWRYLCKRELLSSNYFFEFILFNLWQHCYIETEKRDHLITITPLYFYIDADAI